jgi:hypothetical protein
MGGTNPMKKLLTLILLLVPALAFAQGSPVNSVSLKPVCFAQLTIKPSQADGTVAFCKNCTQTTTCASSGPCLGGSTGALALRLNGAWNCNSGAGGSSSVTGLTNPLIADVAGNTHAVDNVSLTNSNITNSSVNNVINVMAKPYLAKGDGSTDDYNAIQQAIWDATTGGVPFGTCNVTPPANKSVYLPKPSVCYAHSKPIRITCGGLVFGGDQGADPALCNLDYNGIAMVEAPTGTGTLTYGSSLVTGPGNSLVSAPGPIQSFDMNFVLNGTKGGFNLNSLITSTTGFNIAFFMKATGSGGQILGSHQAYPGSGNGAFSFNYDGSNQVTATVNTVTGGLITFAHCPAQTLNNVYELEMDWDKTTYRVWQGVPGGTAVLCDSSASAHPMTQGIFEEAILPDGGPHQFWPDGSSNTQNAFNGFLDSVRFNIGSVHTAAYTVPTTKWPECVIGGPGGCLDLLLLNFETTGVGVDSTQYGRADGWTAAIYFPILGSNGAQVANGYVHDLNLCSNQSSSTDQQKLVDGLYAVNAVGSTWSNVSCFSVTGANYQSGMFTGDFFSKIDGWNSNAGHVALNLNSAWNDSTINNTRVDQTDGACVVNQGGGGAYHHDIDTKCTDRGGLRYGLISNQSSGVYDDFYMDQEAANTVMVAAALLNSPQNTTVFKGGLLAPGTNGVHILQDNGGQGSLFEGTIFQTVGAMPEIIDFTNGAPVSPTLLSATINPTGVAFANAGFLNWIKQPGIDPVYKYTVAASTALILPAIGDSKHIVTLNSNGATPSTPLVLPAGIAQSGPNYQSQFLKAYVCYTGSRSVADGVTNTTTTITSATAAFTAADKGRPVTGSADIPANDYIASVTNGTTAVLNAAATGSHSGQTFNLNNFQPGWVNGVGNAIHGSLPTSTATGNVCDVYNWDYRDPGNVFLDSYTLGLPG